MRTRPGDRGINKRRIGPAVLWIPLVLVSCGLGVAAAPPASADRQFDEVVAPFLARRCLACHSGSEPEGGLDLSRRDSGRKGGKSGVAVVPGRPADSLAWQRVRDGEMPPKKPLPAAEQAIFKAWIAAGARFPHAIDRLRYTTDARAGHDWWSLRPLLRPPLPDPPGGNAANPVDRFIEHRLSRAGLEPSPPADRRTLCRRLYVDLLGLPPTPEDIARFVSTKSPVACEQLVDRLLAHPHHGERWARHWLDIVRFGESQGFERDKLRPNSWRYRDWIVESFNADRRYDEFARLQLAGDVLAPGRPGPLVATGFMVGGAYDEVGQSQQSAAMKAVVRQDELEDYVSTVGQTFLGLTVHCARCHDHKFDPVRQVEYYRMTAALGGVRHGERSLSGGAISTESTARAEAITAGLAGLREMLTRIEAPVRKRALAERKAGRTAVTRPVPIARWDFDGNLNDSVGGLHGTAHGSARVADGHLLLDGKSHVSTRPLARPLKARTLEAWVRLSNRTQRGGGVISLQTLNGTTFDAIVYGEREPGRWMAGSNGFTRTVSFSGPEETAADRQVVHVAIVYAADGMITGYRNGQLYGRSYRSRGPINFAAGSAQLLFGLRHSPPGGNRYLTAAIDQARLYDRALSPEEVAASAGTLSNHVGEKELVARLSESQRRRRASLLFEIDQLGQHRGRWTTLKSYAVAPRQPPAMHLLKRGNTAARGPVVTAGAVAAVPGLPADFGLPADAPDSLRRRKLADWITNPGNPLFARVIVNRLWHYHFGVGLVDTPSDFGFNGGRPSHPELIDWLAVELIEHGWSLKHIHRLILTSATYRQASRFRPAAARVDAGNRLLWRRAPQRLEAETVRDAMLAISGSLNHELGGPGFYDFTTFTRNTQFYVMGDPVGHSFDRRSLYRTWVRSGRNRFLDAFDCPDPSAKAPKRAVTTTPLQALSLLNNSFALRTADRFAARIESIAGHDPTAQVREAFRQVYARRPAAEEQTAAEQLVRDHGAAALARVLFNSNEFLYVD